MNERKSISKTIRFEGIKRDSFNCQYFGNKVLDVDHIQPVSQGGTNDLPELITSCFDCNR
jgi:5-methylcytosine-specific restriction endonuclease McrA